jgi:hypothetical protein
MLLPSPVASPNRPQGTNDTRVRVVGPPRKPAAAEGADLHPFQPDYQDRASISTANETGAPGNPRGRL